ncbi:MAG: NAD(P)H-hydrate dehydratase [Candidatus Aerophobetes bacterium]|nr:NAD(P)H-hydrate dehydratase [Candidatus Aerophobetes bacterium]
MKLVTAEKMRKIDEETINSIGIPGILLMENAGRAVVETIKEEYSPLEEKSVCIFSGSGNNGGDGIVVARHLFAGGIKVRLFLLGRKEKIKGETAINLKIAFNLGVQIKEVTSSEGMKSLKEELKLADIVVDALLGTGAKGAPRGIMKEIVSLINRFSRNIVAVDIPTGVDADTGEVEGEAIKANCTVTFAYPKQGLYLYPGMDYAGKIKVADIGIPYTLPEAETRCNLLTSADIAKDIFKRKLSSHKGNFGHLLVIAGSRGMTGAAALTSLAALRAGAGLVTLGIPESLNPVLEVKLTEAITLPLPQTEEGSLSFRALKKIEEFSKKCEAVALGPGISTNKETAKLVKMLVKQLTIPLIIDADGINVLGDETALLSKYKAPLIITPHPGELSRLLHTSIKEIQKDRIGFALTLAKNTGGIALLKGARTVIADKEGTIWINSTGNPGIASGGSGDVLTGIIGGLLVQGFSTLTAAKLGAYLHGLAGDLAAQIKGEVSLIATDILNNLPEAIRRIKSGCC